MGEKRQQNGNMAQQLKDGRSKQPKLICWGSIKCQSRLAGESRHGWTRLAEEAENAKADLLSYVSQQAKTNPSARRPANYSRKFHPAAPSRGGSSHRYDSLGLGASQLIALATKASTLVATRRRSDEAPCSRGQTYSSRNSLGPCGRTSSERQKVSFLG